MSNCYVWGERKNGGEDRHTSEIHKFRLLYSFDFGMTLMF